MTTIAYHHKSKTVAVDSRTTSGDLIHSDTAIKFIKNDIGTWVFAGCDYDNKALSMLAHKEKSESLDCWAMLIAEGKVYGVSVDDGVCTHTEYNENKTFGSGNHFALAAMDHGKSATEAVKYACTRDIYSGGRVREFKV